MFGHFVGLAFKGLSFQNIFQIEITIHFIYMQQILQMSYSLIFKASSGLPVWS